MKMRRSFLMLAVLVMLFSLFAVTANADIETAESGIDYQVSDDGTYVIVIGFSDLFPNVEIESEIDGLPVKEIAKSAFQNLRQVYSVYIPDSVEIINEAAFRNCMNLQSVRLPAGLTELPFECFRDCKLLNKITLPETLKKIDAYCFSGCTKLGDLKIPASVSEIGYDAFLHCESIRLDCSENEYAQEYAESFNINTEFEGTSLYFAMMMGIGTVVAAVIALIIYFIMRAHIKKHPTHDPAIYIGRFFALIGRGIRFVFSALRKLVMLIVDLVISLIDKLGKKK